MVATLRARASEEFSDSELIAAASTGDREAAGRYLARHLRFLSAMSRRFAMHQIDPEDLLSEAVARLLEKWADGSGPSDHVNAYVIASMKNRVIDELRSARSKTDAIETAELEAMIVGDEDSSLRVVDLHRETELMRRALTRLPEDQRTVLIEMTANGRRPRELSKEMGRPAPAISSLFQRARSALRRAMLVTLLLEGDRVCQENAELLPSKPLASPTEHGFFEPGLAHVLNCQGCRRRWAKWAQIGSALGVLPLLVVSLAPGLPRSGLASASAAELDAPQSLDPTIPARSVRPDGPAPRARGVQANSSASSAPAVSWAPASLVTAVSAFGNSTMAALSVGSAALFAGTALVTAAIFAPGLFPSATPPDVEMRTVGLSDGRTATLSVSFNIKAPSWSVRKFIVELPKTARIASNPSGWSCDSALGGGACQVPAGPVSGDVTVVGIDPTSAATYVVVVEADISDVAVTGTSSGIFRGEVGRTSGRADPVRRP